MTARAPTYIQRLLIQDDALLARIDAQLTDRGVIGQKMREALDSRIAYREYDRRIDRATSVLREREEASKTKELQYLCSNAMRKNTAMHMKSRPFAAIRLLPLYTWNVWQEIGDFADYHEAEYHTYIQQLKVKNLEESQSKHQIAISVADEAIRTAPLH